MLRDGIGFSKVIICCSRVDLRRGIDGLASFVQLNYGIDTLEKGTLFLFRGVKRDRCRGLMWEGDGYTLLTKRLASGNRFQWPKDADEAKRLYFVNKKSALSERFFPTFGLGFPHFPKATCWLFILGSAQTRPSSERQESSFGCFCLTG